jgi:MFS family permease
MGGSWAVSQPAETQRNLKWYAADGFFASACDNILITYLTLYLLALGANSGQIGALSSLSSLMAAVTLLPAALLVEKIGRRKQIVLFGGALARLAIALLAALPLFLGGSGIILTAMGLSLLRDLGGYLLFPAWVSMNADVVPMEGRGRYFAARNFAVGVAGMIVTLFAGELITRAAVPAGYQIAILAAFVLGSASIFSYAHIQDAHPAPAASTQKGSLRSSFGAALRELSLQRGFLALAGTAALWNFFLNIPGPFFNVYLVQNLSASATMVGVTAIASTVSGLVAQRKLGELADRWGARKLQLVTGLLIPSLPLAWMLVRQPWHVILINLLGGAMWAGYSLASFNFLLEVMPEGSRERYSAIYQVVVMLALSAGAAVGGLVVTRWGFLWIFGISGIGRLFAALLFARLVRPKTTQVPVDAAM